MQRIGGNYDIVFTMIATKEIKQCVCVHVFVCACACVCGVCVYVCTNTQIKPKAITTIIIYIYKIQENRGKSGELAL